MRYIILFFFILSSCNNDSIKIPAVTAESSSVDEAKQRIDKMGGYSVIDISTSGKCNRTEGHYIVNRLPIDSADLHFLSQHLAADLFIHGKKDNGCSYPVMSSAVIYSSKDDFEKDQGDYIAICNTMATNFPGDVFINMYKLKKVN